MVIDRLAADIRSHIRTCPGSLEEPALHAVVRENLDESTNLAAACCQIALGAPNGAPRRRRRSGQPGAATRRRLSSTVETAFGATMPRMGLARVLAVLTCLVGCGGGGDAGSDATPGNPVVSFTAATSSYDETDGEVDLYVSIDPPTEDFIKFSINVGGSATPVDDYTGSGEVSWCSHRAETSGG